MSVCAVAVGDREETVTINIDFHDLQKLSLEFDLKYFQIVEDKILLREMAKNQNLSLLKPLK